MSALYVIDAKTDEKIPAIVVPATDADFDLTSDWQTDWRSSDAREMPNKVALHRADNEELLGLMSYDLQEHSLAVRIIYIESAKHSNANLLHAEGKTKRYIGIARALIAHAIEISKDAGFDGVVFFKAKTSELLDYYMREYGAKQVGSYDPFQLVIWEEFAEKILSDYKEDA